MDFDANDKLTAIQKLFNYLGIQKNKQKHAWLILIIAICVSFIISSYLLPEKTFWKLFGFFGLIFIAVLTFLYFLILCLSFIFSKISNWYSLYSYNSDEVKKLRNDSQLITINLSDGHRKAKDLPNKVFGFCTSWDLTEEVKYRLSSGESGSPLILQRNRLDLKHVFEIHKNDNVQLIGFLSFNDLTQVTSNSGNRVTVRFSPKAISGCSNVAQINLENIFYLEESKDGMIDLQIINLSKEERKIAVKNLINESRKDLENIDIQAINQSNQVYRKNLTDWQKNFIKNLQNIGENSLAVEISRIKLQIPYATYNDMQSAEGVWMDEIFNCLNRYIPKLN